MKTIYIKTTESCNLNCKHCFTGGNNPPRTFLNLEKTKDWLGRFTDHHSKDDIYHFELHGGEPFLLPVNELKELVEGIRHLKINNYTIGATTNLVYKLNEDLLDFILNDLDFIGTSWDPYIRFSNNKQAKLWRANLDKIVNLKKERGETVTLNISVSRALIEMNQEELLHYLKTLGVKNILFDRITYNGNARNHYSLFPTNIEINKWYLDLYKAFKKLGARDWFYLNAIEDVLVKFEEGSNKCGTFCRDCEERLFTINGDGTIGGCPNSSPEESFGDIDMSISDLLIANGRLNNIVGEKTRNEECFTCPVFSICGSDCHRLAWEDGVCPSPKELMVELSNISISDESIVKKQRRVIPIMKEIKRENLNG